MRSGSVDGSPAMLIDSALLDLSRLEGWLLQPDRLIDAERPDPMRLLGTS
jgi:hypothetical protein